MKAQKDDKPLYLGHRERLRTRFLKDNGASMDDYEILELLLTYSIPRRDVKPLAKQILAAYNHDFGAVLHAAPEKLIEEFKLSTSTIASFKLVTTCVSRIVSACFEEDKPVFLENLDSIVNFCRNEMAYLDVEEFRVFYLDQNFRYIGQSVMGRGTVNKAHVSVREVAHKALDAKAVFVFFCHNHPSGDCTPSEADVRLTRKLCDNLNGVEIGVLDHLIISKRDVFSFSSVGAIPRLDVQVAMRDVKDKKKLAK